MVEVHQEAIVWWQYLLAFCMPHPGDGFREGGAGRERERERERKGENGGPEGPAEREEREREREREGGGEIFGPGVCPVMTAR